jgi:hypothetical protein
MVSRFCPVGESRPHLPVMPPSLKWQRHIIPPPADVTALVMGDPAPGRSALDQRREDKP